MAKTKGFNDYKILGDTTIIYLSTRSNVVFECFIDTEDLEKLKKLNFRWHPRYSKDTSSYYAMANISSENVNNKQKKTTKHLNTIIMNANNGEMYDHINHNTLDNRKDNLRPVNKIQNALNRRGANSNNSTGYRNVSFVKGKYIIQLQIDGKNKVLGKFDDVHEAGRFAELMRNTYYKEYKGIG